MAKKRADKEFNMSEAIRELLQENPKLSGPETMAALAERYPTAKINKNSFSVAFYTGRKKLGIRSGRRRKRSAEGKAAAPVAQRKISLDVLRTAAKFLSEVGGADAAIEAIKQVQTLQVK